MEIYYRRVHFGTDGEFRPSDDIELKLGECADKFNEKHGYRNNLFLSSYSYSPNCDSEPEEECNKFTRELSARFDQLHDTGLNDIEVIKQLASEGVIRFINRNELKGSVYVGEDDDLAISIIGFIIDISKILPERVFYLYDDSDHLYSPLLIMNGMIKPDIDRINKRLRWWKDKPEWHSGDKYDVTETEKYYNQLIKGETYNVFRTNIKKNSSKE